MNEVRRKNPKSRPRRRLWLLAALALLVAGLVLVMILQPQTPAEIPEREERGGMLVDRNTADIERITIELRDREPWTVLQNEAGELRLDGETDWLVDTTVGEPLLDALAHLNYTELLTEDAAVYETHPEDFGLAEPLITVAVSFRGKTEESLHLRIGDAIEAEESSAYYMVIDGQSPLYAVDAGTVQDLRLEKELLHPVSQPEIHEALLDRVTLRDAAGQITAQWQLRGALTNTDADASWLVTAPFTYPVDEETVQNIREVVSHLFLGLYIGQATEKNLEQYGLITPQGEVELHFGEGSTGTVTDSGIYDVRDWPEENLRFLVGNEKNAMSDYVLFENEIFTVSKTVLGALLSLKPEETVARYPVLTPLNSLSEVTVSRGDRMDRYTLDRSGVSADAAAEAGFRCMKNGEPVSPEAFEAAWQRLLVVTFSGVLPEGASWGEAHTACTITTINGTVHTLVLSDFDGMHDAVTVDGYTRFYLIKGAMTDLLP